MNTDCIGDRLGLILETIEDAASWIDNDPDVSAYLDTAIADLRDLKLRIEIEQFRSRVPA
jgi:hypothetical protein